MFASRITPINFEMSPPSKKTAKTELAFSRLGALRETQLLAPAGRRVTPGPRPAQNGEKSPQEIRTKKPNYQLALLRLLANLKQGILMRGHCLKRARTREKP